MITPRRACPRAARRACAAALFALLAPLAGCNLRNDFFVRDTEGWTYRASCAQRECATAVEAPYAPRPQGGCPRGARPAFVLAGRGVVVACHACVDGAGVRVDDARCRALACEHDNECVPFHDGASVRCVRGLCQTPSRPELDLTASAGLCMAGAGPSGSDRPAHLEDRMALARAACDATTVRCRDPQGCRPR